MTKEEYFKIFRDYRLAEHDLINCRLTWFLTIQGFLFTAYSLLMQKLTEVQVNVKNNLEVHSIIHLKWLLFTISILAICISLSVVMSIYAAFRSLAKLEILWGENIKNQFKKPWLPDPAGAGSESAIFWGSHAPFAIPILLSLAWTCILGHLIWLRM